MDRWLKKILTTSLFLFLISCAQKKFEESQLSLVHSDIQKYDHFMTQKKRELSQKLKIKTGHDWVKAKLKAMVTLDQYTRNFMQTTKDNDYSHREEQNFYKEFIPRMEKIDKQNTKDLKKIIKKYGWPKISTFGKKADHNAWLITQHADLDYKFQQHALSLLESLLKTQDTDSKNYAYLYDRVSISTQNPEPIKEQYYGTQGKCLEDGTWQAFPIKNLKSLEKRRKQMGLTPMSEYKESFKTICRN